MEYTALYRKFRPLTFDGIVGQEHITRTLKNQVQSNRVGHAYLFTGCRGCGKTSSAKVLARAVNCLHPKNGEPCNECEICKAALDGSLTDIVEMDAASNNGVDDIRAIRDEVNFLPTVAKYRVYIIDEVHMLSAGAFNALLKTLEEPPKHVKFILATTEPQKLPATILSRCQRFDFKKIPQDKIVENLKHVCDESKINYTEGALNLIAELSEGAMRDALSILERCAQDGENSIEEEKIKEIVGIPETKYIMNIAEKIINFDQENALISTQEVINSGKDVTNLLWELIKFFRDLMLLKTTKNISNVYSKEDVSQMQALSESISTDRILKIIYSLSELENDLKWSTQKNIVFQVGIIKLCSNESKSIEERVEALENSVKAGNFANVKGMPFQNYIPMNQKANISTNVSQKVENSSQNSNENVNTNQNSANNNKANLEQSSNNTVKESEQKQNLTPSNVANGNQSSIESASSTNKNNLMKSNENSSNKSNINSKDTSSNNTQNASKPSQPKSQVAPFWGNVIKTLKEERQPMLYANLMNTRGILIDDMTFGIQFPNGLNSFGKSIIEKPENMSELKRLVSIECKKDMRIKLLDKNSVSNNAKEATQTQENGASNGLDSLGIDINVIN